jgi:class 3 adenylate cyclase
VEDPFTFSRRSLLCSDAARYSTRNDVQQHELQQALVEVIRKASAAAGFDRSKWGVQSSGDGELAVVPAEVPEWTVIDDFPAALTDSLATYNAGRCEETRLRMRLAIHYGLVSPAAGGYAGQGVVAVSRLVNSEIARRALDACPAADLVVLLSSSLFNDVVLQGHTRLSHKDLREVLVKNKTFTDPAWLWVPGHDAHALRLDEPPPPDDDERTKWWRMAT